MKKSTLLNLPKEKVDRIMEEVNRGPNLLSLKEKMIIVLRLGIVGGRQHTLDEIGKELGGITRERVRQIEDKIISKF